jgi:hypothetical protein
MKIAGDAKGKTSVGAKWQEHCWEVALWSSTRQPPGQGQRQTQRTCKHICSRSVLTVSSMSSGCCAEPGGRGDCGAEPEPADEPESDGEPDGKPDCKPDDGLLENANLRELDSGELDGACWPRVCGVLKRGVFCAKPVNE